MTTTPEDNAGTRLLSAIERLFALFSGIAIGVIMLTVVADVSMRYLLRQPLAWSYDMIGTYLMVAGFFLALSDTLRNHGHIAIDMFTHKLPRPMLHISLGVGYALAVIILTIIALQAGHRMIAAWRGGDLISASVSWPTWPSYFLAFIGTALIALRCLIRAALHFGSCVTGRDRPGLLYSPHEDQPEKEQL